MSVFNDETFPNGAYDASMADSCDLTPAHCCHRSGLGASSVLAITCKWARSAHDWRLSLQNCTCFCCTVLSASDTPGLQPALPEKRRTLFFFVGDSRPYDPKYSHGVRQAVMLLNNTPGGRMLTCGTCVSPTRPHGAPAAAAQYSRQNPEGQIVRTPCQRTPQAHAWASHLTSVHAATCSSLLSPAQTTCRPQSPCWHSPDSAQAFIKLSLL